MAPSIHRCACGALLVDVREPDGTIGRACAKCLPLVLIDVVRQLHVRKDQPT